jgi:hypothetical protein
MLIHQYFIDFFLMFFFFASFIGAIISLISGEVEFKSRAFLWGNYRVLHLRGKPAYIYAVCTLIGSFILISNLSLKPVFGIETGTWGLLFWGFGIVFYIIAGTIAGKYLEER